MSALDWILTALNVFVLWQLLPKALHEFRNRKGKQKEIP